MGWCFYIFRKAWIAVLLNFYIGYLGVNCLLSINLLISIWEELNNLHLLVCSIGIVGINTSIFQQHQPTNWIGYMVGL